MSDSEDSHDEEGESGGDDENFIALTAPIHSRGNVSKSEGETSKEFKLYRL